MVRYEDLVENPEGETARISDFIPGIGPLDTGACFRIKERNQPISDLNESQIARLSDARILQINAVLERYPHLWKEFGYELRDPGSFAAKRVFMKAVSRLPFQRPCGPTRWVNLKTIEDRRKSSPVNRIDKAGETYSPPVVKMS